MKKDNEKMKAIFISDAHLKRFTEERYGQLINFLCDLKKGKARYLVNSDELVKEDAPISDLYILGDLFDFWFCQKDKINPEFHLIINKLVELQKAGIRIHLVEGNHDFFLKEYFHDVLGMEVFEEWACVKLDNVQTLIAHGDTVDGNNQAYIILRKVLRSSVFYHLQRLIPASVRWALANISSRTSKTMTVENGDVLVEKMLSFAIKKLQQDYDAVILGHCHKPVLRYVDVQGRKKTFVTLGDWINHYSFLYYENKNFYLGYYRPR